MTTTTPAKAEAEISLTNRDEDLSDCCEGDVDKEGCRKENEDPLSEVAAAS